MTAKTEASVIRSQLRLRKDYLTGECEVYTTVHGSGVFRWFRISQNNFAWYMSNFPEIPFEATNVPDKETGALNESSTI